MPPKPRLNFDTVRKIALALEGVEEVTTWGVSGFKVRGTLMVCPAINKSAEPDSLMARVGFDERDTLIAEDPDVYYVTDHYRGYPTVLARLPRMREDALRGLVEMAWHFASTSRRKK